MKLGYSICLRKLKSFCGKEILVVVFPAFPEFRINHNLVLYWYPALRLTKFILTEEADFNSEKETECRIVSLLIRYSKMKIHIVKRFLSVFFFIKGKMKSVPLCSCHSSWQTIHFLFGINSCDHQEQNLKPSKWVNCENALSSMNNLFFGFQRHLFLFLFSFSFVLFFFAIGNRIN